MNRIRINKILAVILILLLTLGMLSGCKKKDQPSEPSSISETAEENREEDQESQENQGENQSESQDENQGESSQEESLDEDGYYYSKDDVALYLHIYGHLPDNYITKKEAKKLGWTGGTPEKFVPGSAIGGDKFGNYEGTLPEDKTYYECDIDTKGKKKRGAKRIVWSEDGYIYYTDDHYESFELLYEGD